MVKMLNYTEEDRENFEGEDSQHFAEEVCDKSDIKEFIGYLSVNNFEYDSCQPLFYATGAKSLGIFHMLLELECNPNDKTEDGVDILSFSMFDSKISEDELLERFKILIEKYNVEINCHVIDEQDGINNPLLNALWRGYKKIMRYLIEKGAVLIPHNLDLSDVRFDVEALEMLSLLENFDDFIEKNRKWIINHGVHYSDGQFKQYPNKDVIEYVERI